MQTSLTRGVMVENVDGAPEGKSNGIVYIECLGGEKKEDEVKFEQIFTFVDIKKDIQHPKCQRI